MAVTNIQKLVERFSRQILVKEIGVKGQLKLASSRVAIVGCGATGTFEAELLARLGVGFIRVIDKDIVELSNLHRTLLFTESDVEELKPKAIACKEHLAKINSSVTIEAVVDRLTPSNAEKLLSDVDLILDGTDDMHTRYIINEVAVKNKIPWIYVGVEQWYATVMPIIPGKTPCLKCIMPQAPRRRVNVCEILGVVNTVVGLATSIAVSDAVKILLGHDIESRLYVIDSLRNEVEKVIVHRNPKCPLCVLKQYEYLGKTEERIVTVCGSNQVEVIPGENMKVPLEKLVDTNGLHVIKKNPYVAKLKLNGHEIILFNNGRALILNTVDQEKAIKVFNKLFTILKHLGLIKVHHGIEINNQT